MKKFGILNREINSAIGKLGHTDLICICDCGLPINDDIKVVDLCIELNNPLFMDVVKIIKEHVQIEKQYLALEIKANNSIVNNQMQDDLIETEYVSHEDFKKLSQQVKLIIRTGEASPYANVIFQSGVLF